MNAVAKFAPWMIALVLGAALLFQARQRAELEAKVSALESAQHSLRATIENAKEAPPRVAREAAVSPPKPSPALGTAAAPRDTMAWRVAELRDFVSRLTDQSIPELSLATEGDWYVAAAGDGPLENVDEYRAALARLRGLAEQRFAAKAQPALQAFMDAHNGAFPKNTAELAPYFPAPMAADILARYKVVAASEVPNVRMGGDWIIVPTGVVDSDHDARMVIGPRGFGMVGPSKQKQK